MNSHTDDLSMSVEAPPKHSEPCAEDDDDVERESPFLPSANALALAGMTPSQDSDCSQAPTRGITVALSQQPSPELLMSLGVKVRDFAYESTLPAIVPVPRVPRQVQPAPRTLKRSHRDWDEKEDYSSSPGRPTLGKTATKKRRSLERKATEPLQEPVVQHTRTLERITMKTVCSVLTPPPRHTTPRPRFSTSPPTSPLTPLPASQESQLVQTSSAFPFVVHVDNTGAIPAPQLGSERPVALCPVLYTRITLDSRASPCGSPVSGSPQNGSPAPIISSFLEVPSPAKESRVPRIRVRRTGGTPPSSNRYQLRQRPVPSSTRASTHSHQVNSTSKSLPRRTRRSP